MVYSNVVLRREKLVWGHVKIDKKKSELLNM